MFTNWHSHLSSMNHLRFANVGGKKVCPLVPMTSREETHREDFISAYSSHLLFPAFLSRVDFKCESFTNTLV